MRWDEFNDFFQPEEYSPGDIVPTGVVKEWDIELLRGYEDGDGVELEKTITAPTYAECEAKARAYLNGLPDAGKDAKG